MRRAALLALACSVAAGAPDVRLPAVADAQKIPEGAAVVTLTADGLVVVDRDGKHEPVSLDQLASWLQEQKKRLDKADETRASKMPLVLRADEQAPWRHVQHVLMVCAEAKIWRTSFGVKGARGEEGAIQAHLPADAAPSPATASITVRISASKEDTIAWGPSQTAVQVPTEITYNMADIVAKDIEAVRRFIRDACQTGATDDAVPVGEIRAGPTIPVSVVLPVVTEFHRAGLMQVEFYGTEAPSPEERRVPRLSYPK